MADCASLIRPTREGLFASTLLGAGRLILAAPLLALGLRIACRNAAGDAGGDTGFHRTATAILSIGGGDNEQREGGQKYSDHGISFSAW